MSTSPSAIPGAETEGEQGKKGLEQITFRFCRECSNMLYPKEDRDRNVLMFACRTCQFSEEATSSCVFRNVLHNSVGETAGVTQDVGSDPTVGLPDTCLLCGCIATCEVCGLEVCNGDRVTRTETEDWKSSEGESDWDFIDYAEEDQQSQKT